MQKYFVAFFAGESHKNEMILLLLLLLLLFTFDIFYSNKPSAVHVIYKLQD